MSSPKAEVGRVQVRVERAEHHRAKVEDDWVAAEEPLEIAVNGESLVVTLRTPGNDLELATGFLHSEGIVQRAEEIEALEHCQDPMAYDPDNLVQVTLSPGAEERQEALRRARREFTAVAACGLCGKGRLEDVFQRLPKIQPMTPDLDLLASLPERMKEHQTLFHSTGGLHAAALFDREGNLLSLFEDIGRHNAVDKVIGHHLLRGEVPLHQHILVVTARAGFEIVQKAMMASIPILGAVGASSSLAVQTARDGGLELVSFLAPGRGNRHV